MKIGAIYIEDYTNAESDFFAMYCKKEHLTIDDFIWIGSDKYMEYYTDPMLFFLKTRDYTPVSHVEVISEVPRLTREEKQSIVDYHNMIFAQALALMSWRGWIKIP